MPDNFYVTTPIYYVNDKPHIGHAYCTILADAAARAHRLLGARTYFLTGTDEHGQKVEEAAKNRGIDPQTHCDELHVAFKSLWPKLLCAPDQFIRTTEPRHKQVVQAALQRLFERGLVVPREFEGWYCVPDERFWTEKELVDGKCPACGRPVVRLKERNWFFLMSRYQSLLKNAIASGEVTFVPAARANEVLGFLDKPMQDLCISRPKSRLQWGIELPFDRDFVTYVWFDALLNYATAVGFLRAEPPSDGAQWPDPALDAESNFAQWWPAVTHCLGKDILTTHAVYWPTMLMGLAEAYDLPAKSWMPRRFVATGWWLIDNAKMSKSLGNVVDPAALAGKYGPEVLRWFLVREMAVGQDSSFSEEALVRRNNDELANDFGNLLQRVSALVEKYFGGQVPQAPSADPQTDAQRAVFDAAALLLLPASDAADDASAQGHIRAFRLHRLAGDAMGLVRRLNELVQHDAPFRTARDNLPAAAQTLYFALEGLRIAAHLLQPVLPQACATVLERIGAGANVLPLGQLRWGQLPAGAPVTVGAPLFAKFELPLAAPVPALVAAPAPVPAPAAAAAAVPAAVPAPDPAPAAAAEAKPPISIDQFAAIDLRVGTVVSAEPVPKSHKLLRLLIDLGEGQPRQILSGIAESFAPQQLTGQQVLVLANLAPRKMMGLESHGMVLVAENAAGQRVLVQPADAAPPGATVR